MLFILIQVLSSFSKFTHFMHFFVKILILKAQER